MVGSFDPSILNSDKTSSNPWSEATVPAVPESTNIQSLPFFHTQSFGSLARNILTGFLATGAAIVSAAEPASDKAVDAENQAPPVPAAAVPIESQAPLYNLQAEGFARVQTAVAQAEAMYGVLSQELIAREPGSASASETLSAELPLNVRETCRLGLLGVAREDDEGGVTSLPGSLQLKAETLDPKLAGDLICRLYELNISDGSSIYIGSTGSFPGLLTAALSAVQARNDLPYLSLTVGASEYGANRENFTNIDMFEVLTDHNMLDAVLQNASIGGEGDIGTNISEEGREVIRARIRQAAVPIIEEPTVVQSVAERIESLETWEALHGRVSVAIIIGGSVALMGGEDTTLAPGLNTAQTVELASSPVCMARYFLERGTPVIWGRSRESIATPFDAAVLEGVEQAQVAQINR